jgi:hypothetical protein
MVSPGFAGPLDPPGAPASTPGPEPRIALNAQNTPGDAESVFRITLPGSYYLTSDLIGESGRHGIKIAASDVAIDLMGYSVRGVAGSIDGIRTEGLRDNLSIRNGTVRSWGLTGINLTAGGAGFTSHIDKVRIVHNGTIGMRTNQDALVTDTLAEFNGTSGINLSLSGMVVNCVSNNNGSTGISTGLAASIVDSVAYSNGGTGIIASIGSSVRNCVTYSNSGSGIATGSASSVVNCTVYSNEINGITVGGRCSVIDCVSELNALIGITTGSGALVRGSLAADNGSHGITLGADCEARNNKCVGNGTGSGAGINTIAIGSRIEGNDCSENDIGIRVTAAGNFIAANTCSSNGTNWEIAAGNKCLVVSAANAPAINGDSGGASPGSNSAWANYTY